MGLGEALMEEMVHRDHERRLVHKWPSLLEYKSPTTLEMCDVVTYLVEHPDPNGPFGAKEAGQGPLNPVMPAIANAIYDAVGVRIDEVPMSAPKVLKAIQAKAKGKEPRFGPSGTPTVPWPERTYVRTPRRATAGRWAGGSGPNGGRILRIRRWDRRTSVIPTSVCRPSRAWVSAGAAGAHAAGGPTSIPT
jgi:4-hydroxybenzoyl-CoA reductase subunit alpha